MNIVHKPSPPAIQQPKALEHSADKDVALGGEHQRGSSVVRLRMQTLIYWSSEAVALLHIGAKRNILSFARCGLESLDWVTPTPTLQSFMATENTRGDEADPRIKVLAKPRCQPLFGSCSDSPLLI